jgi:signal transduction histidine kinase
MLLAWMRPRSLRARLILWNSLTVALIIAVLGFVLSSTTQVYLLSVVDRDLEMRLRGPMLGMRRSGGPPGFPFLPPPYSDRPRRGIPPPGMEPANESGIRFRPHLYAPDGSVLAPPDAANGPWDSKGLQQALQGMEQFTTVRIENQPVRVLSHPIFEEGKVQAVWQIPYPLTDIYRAINGVNETLLLLFPAALLGAGLGGYLLTRRVLRPVQQVAQTAEAISAEALSRRLPVVGEDEFARLSVTFNQMLERLDTAFAAQTRLLEQQRQFIANASHELKTPLAVIKANTSLTLSSPPDRDECLAALEDIDSAAGSMTHLVQDLLLLARADEGQLARQPMELLLREPLLAAIARVRRADRAPISLHLAEETLTVRGCPDELTRLFSNLLENAARHTPPDGAITLTAGRGEGKVCIEVTDTGCGIAPEHLPHLGERFYRIDTGRARTEGGSGLGLSICKRIVEAHGGSIAFESIAGQGTTVRVLLPAAS